MTVTWDPVKRSPQVHVSNDGSTVQCPLDVTSTWHAAFLHVGTRLHSGITFARFDFLLEELKGGGGLVEIGLVTRNEAKRAALHWPGLRDTSAWTYASTGCRFWNIPGADEETWCQDFGEEYGPSDTISLELESGSLRFLRNGCLQGVALEQLPAGNFFLGATLCAGSRLRILKADVRK